MFRHQQRVPKTDLEPHAQPRGNTETNETLNARKHPRVKDAPYIDVLLTLNVLQLNLGVRESLPKFIDAFLGDSRAGDLQISQFGQTF